MLKWTLVVLLLIVIISVISVNVGRFVFDRKVKKEVQELFAESAHPKTEIITEEDLSGLPEPVQKWLRNSQVVGREKVLTVRLKQRGSIRTEEKGNWMPFKAEQYYTTEVPGFIWYANVKLAPMLHLKGRDRYYDGRGNMLIKLLSLINVADAVGPEMDQGTLIRFLNEIMWFPGAAINEYIEWEPIDEFSAQGTMEYKGVRASAIFYFSEDGDLINFVAERYMENNGSFSIEKWATPIEDYDIINGIRIPTRGKAVWQLETGDFPYIDIEIMDIEYNNPVLYK